MCEASYYVGAVDISQLLRALWLVDLVVCIIKYRPLEFVSSSMQFQEI